MLQPHDEDRVFPSERHQLVETDLIATDQPEYAGHRPAGRGQPHLSGRRSEPLAQPVTGQPGDR